MGEDSADDHSDQQQPVDVSVFDQDGRYYMTAVAGGVAQYDLTITLSAAEVTAFQADETKAIATCRDLITRTQAFEHRLVTPAIDPT